MSLGSEEKVSLGSEEKASLGPEERVSLDLDGASCSMPFAIWGVSEGVLMKRSSFTSTCGCANSWRKGIHPRTRRPRHGAGSATWIAHERTVSRPTFGFDVEGTGGK